MKNLVIIMLLALLTSSCAKNDDSLVETFFKVYEEHGSNQAIDSLFSSNKWLVKSKTQVNKTKQDLAESLTLLGNYNGYELISVSKIGENLKHYTYLVRYDRQPLRFSITIYKSSNNWQVQNFNYDYAFIEEINAASSFSHP